MNLPTVRNFLKDHSGPVTLKVIASACGVSRRDAEQEVNRLRLDGCPLISDSDGIRWSRDPAEVKACADRLRTRAIHQYLTVRALTRTARRLEGIAQTSLWRDAA